MTPLWKEADLVADVPYVAWVECLVCSFTGDNLATFLSYPVGPRDAMIGLGIGDADTVMVPSPVYIPDPARHVYCHPAEMGGEEGGEEKGEGRKFVAMLS